MLFSKEKRPGLPKTLTFGETGKKLGEMWRGLSEKEKAKYKK